MKFVPFLTKYQQPMKDTKSSKASTASYKNVDYHYKFKIPAEYRLRY